MMRPAPLQVKLAMENKIDHQHYNVNRNQLGRTNSARFRHGDQHTVGGCYTRFLMGSPGGKRVWRGRLAS